MERAVIQGGLDSCQMFSTMLDESTKLLYAKWVAEKRGIDLGNGYRLVLLYFADNIFVFAKSIKEAKLLLKELRLTLERVRWRLPDDRWEWATNIKAKKEDWISEITKNLFLFTTKIHLLKPWGNISV